MLLVRNLQLVPHIGYHISSSQNLEISHIYLNVFIQVLHAFATEGAHCTKVRDILNASNVSLNKLFIFSSLNVLVLF
jgi:hypothetical protein